MTKGSPSRTPYVSGEEGIGSASTTDIGFQRWFDNSKALEAQGKYEPFEFTDLGPFLKRTNAPVALQAQQHVVSEGIAWGREHLVAIDGRGKVIGNIRGDPTRVGVTASVEDALRTPGSDVVVHHNHPTNGSFSPRDLAMLGNPGMRAIWAHGHNGNTFRAELTPAALDVVRKDSRPIVGLHAVANAVSTRLYDHIQRLVDDGAVHPEAAMHVHWHLVSDILRRSGVIDYAHNVNHDALIEKLRLEPLIRNIAHEIQGKFFSGRTAQPDARRAEPLRYPGDVGASFERPTEVAAQREPRRAVSARRAHPRRQESDAQLSLGFSSPSGIYTRPPPPGSTAPPGPYNIMRSAAGAGRLRQAIDRALRGPVATKMGEGLWDLNRRIRMLRDEIAARQMGTLPDSQDFYTRKRLFPGRVGNATDEFDKKHLEPLVRFLEGAKINLDEAGSYLYARHAQERNAAMAAINNPNLATAATMTPGQPGSGMSDQEAHAILHAAHSSGKAAQFRELADRVGRMRDWILRFMEKSGLEHPNVIAAWRNKYRDYVPLKGFEVHDPNRPEDIGGPGRGADVRGRETRQAFGRVTKADNPLINLIEQGVTTIERGERNRYLQTLYRALQDLAPADRSDIATLNRGDPKRAIDPRTGLVRVVDSKNEYMNPDAVYLKIGGSPHFMVFKDPVLADRIKTLSPIGNEALYFILKLQNKFKAIWTHYSPDFLVGHFLSRYPLEGTLNSIEQKESGRHSVAKYFGQGAPFIGKASRAIFASNKGVRSTDPGIAQLQDHWEEMRKAGGAMMFRNMRDIDMTREHIKTRLLGLQGRPIATVREKWRRGIEAMDVVTNALDNALRLAAYSSARNQGKTIDQSALIAREATVDFNLKGRWSQILGVWAPFANVALETGSRGVRAVARSRYMRRTFVGLIAAGFLTSMWNYLMGGNDEDGVPYFDKIGEWEKRLNYIVLNPWTRDSKGRPQPFKLPMPYFWASPLTMGYALGNQVFGTMKLGKALGMVTHSMLEALTPIGNEASTAGLAAPELLRPFVHVSANKDWAGRPVHTDPMFQHGPDSESPLRGKRQAGIGYQLAAKAINYGTGGSSTKSGLIDVHPEDIREILGYMISTPIKEASEFVTTGKSLFKGEAPDPTQIPMTRRFFGADYDAATAAHLAEQKHAITHPWEGGASMKDVADWQKHERVFLNEQYEKIKADKSLSEEDRKTQLQDMRKQLENVQRTADHARAEIRKKVTKERQTGGVNVAPALP